MDENGPFIIDLPAKIVIYHSYVKNYQRVRHLLGELHPPSGECVKTNRHKKSLCGHCESKRVQRSLEFYPIRMLDVYVPCT